MSKKVQPNPKKQAESTVNNKAFAIGKKNYTLIAIGFGIMVLGFLLMIGGGTDDPRVFDGDKLFSFRRITLAPFIIVAGLVFEIYAIMKKPKAE